MIVKPTGYYRYACIFKVCDICAGKDVYALINRFQSTRNRYHFQNSPVLGMPSPWGIVFVSHGSCSWFLSVYVKEIWSRLPELLAAATTVYGSILKIDSTKKVCKKLQGTAANSASWCTNVGNEHGEIL